MIWVVVVQVALSLFSDLKLPHLDAAIVASGDDGVAVQPGDARHLTLRVGLCGEKKI